MGSVPSQLRPRPSFRNKELSTITCCGCWKNMPKLPGVNKHKTEAFFYSAAFLPRFIRQAIKGGIEDDLPTTITMSTIILQIEVPITRELTDMYLDNIDVQRNVVHETNLFFSAIMELLQCKGGDIYLLIDSTLKCLWNIEEVNFPEALEFILELAFYIKEDFCPQYSVGAWTMETISSISVGNAKILIIGDKDERILWCVTGDVIQKGHTGRGIGEHGDVILTNEAWDYLGEHQYKYVSTSITETFLKVAKIKKGRKNTFGSTTSDLSKENKEEGLKFLQASSLYEELIELKCLQESFQPCVRNCIHPLINRAVTMQQLEILSAMTPVVVCAFVLKNIDLESVGPLNTAFKHVMKITARHEGIVTKMDYHMDVIFCVTFGSTGFKHIDDGARAIKWGRDIIGEMTEMGYEGVVRICSGMCYSGVLGPQQRMEWALIGKPLFTTLTLNHKFPDIPIVCGSNTALMCRREFGNLFKLIFQRARGLKHILPCYAVNFTQSPQESDDGYFGREDKKAAVWKALEEVKNLPIDVKHTLPLIIIKGEVGIGKTFFLTFLTEQARKLGNILTCFVGSLPYEETNEKAWYIVKKLLALNFVHKECDIIELLGTDIDKYPLHLLNKHFDTKFPMENVDEEMQPVLLRKMFLKLLQQCAKGKRILIAIDEGEHVAQQTALFLQDLLVSRTASVIMSFNDPYSLESRCVEQLVNRSYKVVLFEPLSEDTISSLACHYLNIVAIHKQICSFLYKNSKGNPLRLQEILLLPQLQHHFCFVEYRSIAPWKLEKSFVQLKDVSDEKAESAKVCDILDLEGLENVYVPENLLDVVREHTSGLSPEEQMLIKKCAILGSTFSFYILESVCPEYTMNDLRNSVAKLVRKNMLVLGCHHLMIDDCGLHRKSLTEMDDEYCFHPMKFSSEFLQQCVVNFMQQAQRDRIHLFIVSLLKEITITCDSCKMHRGEQTLKQNDCFPCQMNIPRLNLLTCFCRNFQISVYTEIRSHLKQSNAPIERQVMFMLKAASTALEAEKELLVGDFLEEAEDFANVPEHNYSSAQLIKAIILRLQAQRHYFLGAVDEAMASITQALEYIGKRFPADYLKPRLRHQPPHENFSILEEECKCLAVGCKILLEESRFDEAFDIAKTCGILFDIFGGAEHDNQFPEFTDILTKDCLLMITAANMQSRKRETKCRQTILHNCSHKLSKEAIVSTRYLESILLALIDVTYTLFAENKLEMAETVGFRVVQICRITKGVKQLIMVTPILCLVYYYSKETVKSFQMLSGFLNYAGTSGDMISEAMFYSMCMQLLLSMDCPETRCDKMKMCTTFASSKCEQTFHAGNIAHRYWIAAMMSEWCFEQNLMDAFKSWHAMADNLKPAVTMTNFWSLSGELKMIKISILKIKRKLEEKEKASEEINSVKKKLKSIERLINRYACVAMVDVKQTKKMLKKISLM